MVSGGSKLVPGPAPEGTLASGFLFFKRFLAAGAAMSIAEVTLPIDTAKVQLQIQGQSKLPPGKKPYTGLFNCLSRIASEDGVTSLYRGLGPAVARQLVYGGLRLCLYDYVKGAIHKTVQGGEGNAWLTTKILSGLATGGMAMSVAQPTDVVKIRFQAEPGRYSSMASAFVTIARQDGVKGLWRGLGPNITRNAVINAAELATYDQIKQMLIDLTPMKDNIATHWSAALGAGFIAVIIGSPIDVVKTRIMNAKPEADGSLTYRSTPHAFAKILKNEGPLAFYNGFWPNFARLGSWSIVMFMSYEQIKNTFKGPLNFEMAH